MALDHVFQGKVYVIDGVSQAKWQEIVLNKKM
ncbi:uncharacterized protein G2W53_044687 [Senna tora]|uniref:Uncharacterized protein n=1 Tax=Senna tora TaxID=362788 RepID=A0A834SCV4_9FABA|nr:uncharacterized protein G2W53_044687 [Senna tora]